MIRSLILGRVLSLVPTLLIASFVVFLLVQIIPGDPALTILGDQATEEQRQAVREQLGLDEPLPVQYWTWLSSAVAGDLGQSVLSGEQVSAAIARTLPVTVTMVIGAMVVALTVGIAAGIGAALHVNRPLDRIVTGVAALGVAMPGFWVGLILVTIFAVQLRWFPATGGVSIFSDPAEAIRYMVLPSVAMGITGAAEVARHVRSAMIQALSSDFVRTHRAKGLVDRAVIARALKNAAVPILSVVGLLVNSYLGATVVIESVFGIPGVGSLIIRATLAKDFPIIQGVVLTIALIAIFSNLIVDLAYRLVDPRIR